MTHFVYLQKCQRKTESESRKSFLTCKTTCLCDTDAPDMCESLRVLGVYLESEQDFGSGISDSPGPTGELHASKPTPLILMLNYVRLSMEPLPAPTLLTLA